jgi:photosystem II stability/assembly factor-like uncharacterized protein
MFGIQFKITLILLYVCLAAFSYCGDDELLGQYGEKDRRKIKFSLYNINSFNNQLITTGSGKKIFLSEDALNWEYHQVGHPFFITDLAYNLQDKYIGVGPDGKILSSADLVSWIEEDYPPRLDGGEEQLDWLSSITFNGTFFIAFGSNNLLRYSSGSDGSEWNDDAVITDGNIDDHFFDLAFNDSEPPDRYVAVGYGGGILNSTDGINWTRTDISADIGESYTLHSVVFADPYRDGGFFLAVGNQATILKSNSSGTNWIKQDVRSIAEETYSTPDLHAVHYSKNLSGLDIFLAVGEAGTILLSLDAASWIKMNSNTENALYAVDYNVINDLGYHTAVGFNRTIRTKKEDEVNWKRVSISKAAE